MDTRVPQLVVLSCLLSGCLGGMQTRDGGDSTADRLAELEARIQRLENRVESGQLLELLQRVDALQEELRMLRGDTERTGHEIESMGRRQRELYLDLDRRLQNMESGGRVQPPGGQPGGQPRVDARDIAGPAGQEQGGQRVRYESAFRLLQEGRYPASINAFQQYLDEFPDGDFADNAQYWLGEAYYVTREYATAGEEFRKVLERFTESQKVPDAMLKLGYVHYELKQWDEARRILSAVSERVPGTTIARLAEQRLQRMRQEGR